MRRGLLIGGGLAGLVTLVAIASRAPLSGAGHVNAASARSPAVALFFIIGAGATIVLVGLFVLMFPRRLRDDRPYAGFDARVHWIWKLLAVALPVALVDLLVAAAVVGLAHSHHPLRPPGVPRAGLPPARPISGHGGGGFVPPSWAVVVFLSLLGLAVLIGLAFRFGRSWPRMGEDRTSETPSGRGGEAVQAAIEAISAREDPRSAVVAAYAAMESTLGRYGAGRLPAEAPREYLDRALLEVGAPRREATVLRELFERARFSFLPIAERDRHRALDVLRAVQGALAEEEAG